MLDASSTTAYRPDLQLRFAGVIVRVGMFGRGEVSIEPYSAEIAAVWSWAAPRPLSAARGHAAVYYKAAAFALPGGPV